VVKKQPLSPPPNKKNFEWLYSEFNLMYRISLKSYEKAVISLKKRKILQFNKDKNHQTFQLVQYVGKYSIES